MISGTNFNTEVIITQPFVKTAIEIGFAIRRLGKIKVKGRVCPEILYAFGDVRDPRFAVNEIEAWEKWLTAIERKEKTDAACPAVFAQDEATIINWQKRKDSSFDFSFKRIPIQRKYQFQSGSFRIFTMFFNDMWRTVKILLHMKIFLFRT